MAQSRIGITGGKGLLGATLLRTPGFPAVALSSDIRDVNSLKREIHAHENLSWIVHAAAWTDVELCERDPDGAYAVNAQGTKNVLDAARAENARVIYISTASVFSGIGGNYREDDVPEPNNVYNRTKVAGEAFVRTSEGAIILRLNLVGIHPLGSRGKNFLEWIIDSVRGNKNMNAFTDVHINPLTNWTVPNFIQTIIERKSGGRILHIGSSDVVSKADIVELVAKQFPNYRGTITRTSIESIKDGIARPKQMWLNCDYTKKELGIMMPSVKEEIKKALALLKA